MLFVFVESGEDGVGSQSRRSIIKVGSKGFDWCEVDSDFGLPFDVFELKEILLFVNLLFLASSGVFSHWRKLKIIKSPN